MKTTALLIPAALISAGPLLAQSDNQSISDVTELEEVFVFSQSTTQSNAVLSLEQLELASPMTSALDHIDRLPGVVVQEGDAYGGDDWSTSVSIRGFQTDRNSSQLGYTIDGLPNGNTNYGGGAKPNRFIDSENIGSVVVSQGAGDIASASTTALGGTIQYMMIDPGYEESVSVQYSTGDNNMRRYFLRYNTGEIGENTRAFISLSDSFHNRWTSEGENGLADRLHVDSKVVSKWGQVNVEARLSYDDIHEDNYNGVTLEQFAANPNWDYLTGEWTGMPNPDQYFVEGWSTVRENTLGGLKLDMPLGDNGTLMLQPYFHSQSGEGHWIPPYQRRGWDEEGNPTSIAQLAATEARVFFYDAAGNDILPLDEDGNPLANPFDIETYPEAVQAGAVPASSFRTSHYGNSRIGARANYTLKTEGNTLDVGFWYEQQERDSGRDWHKILDASVGMEYDYRPYWTDFDQTFDTDTTMLYVQDTIEWGSVTAQIGLKQYYVELSGYDNIASESLGSLDSDSDLLPSVGLLYDLGDHAGQLFANYTENFSAINDNVLLRDASPSLAPEQSDSIDLGYRYTRDRLSFTASTYMIEFDNKISFVDPGDDDLTEIDYDIGTGGGFVNVGGIESKGLELAANYQFNSAFSGYVSATYNDSEYTKTVPENGVVAGNEVVGSVSELLTASLFYRSEAGYYASLAAKWTGDRQGTLDNSEQMEAYTKVDMTFGYRRAFDTDDGFVKALRAELRVYNAFDARYLATPDGDARVSAGAYFIGAPRNVSMTFGLEF
ncbi:TonB-dependent receptor [Pelagicoccus sp. SDUM812003]|uniref:TonB-dependent receptor n=1 Tax=Pelagicoccus sp. SDUM812003 TaxID=3041267 RepID=UPI00280D5305|nr:TonB-dependent receptor [Pelagicoccus sp. SDUM812003]MDQ8202281.1 TonB-dependent receptor [Pelagicoccus sp. SDUM812003]